MSDLIERQDAINILRHHLDEDYLDGYVYWNELKAIPSAEPEERTAKVMSDGINYCGNCEGYVEAPMAYCPYCGARLEWNE